MREIAVLAEAEVARAREIAVFAEAQVAPVREIAVFADVQVAPRSEDPEDSEDPKQRCLRKLKWRLCVS